MTETTTLDTNALAQDLSRQLDEPNITLLCTVIKAIGPEQAQAHLTEALATEANGGMLTADGSRRRTLGGIFFLLARKAMPGPIRRKIWPFTSQSKAPPSPNQPPPPPSWDEAKQLVIEALQAIGEAKTVKITLVGRPGRVIQQANCVVVAMKGKEPPSLPKGLPTPPANSAVTWAVFIANKQWAKVKASIQANKEDQLVIEGYPLIDPKSNASVVLASNVKSVAMEKAQRAPQQAKTGKP